jgi:CcmD family protein
MKKLIFLVAMLFSFTAVNAQPGSDIQMADALRTSGMIYVVVITIVIIFTGLAIYLFSIDRRLKKIEKEN